MKRLVFFVLIGLMLEPPVFGADLIGLNKTINETCTWLQRRIFRSKGRHREKYINQLQCLQTLKGLTDNEKRRNHRKYLTAFSLFRSMKSSAFILPLCDRPPDVGSVASLTGKSLSSVQIFDPMESFGSGASSCNLNFIKGKMNLGMEVIQEDDSDNDWGQPASIADLLKGTMQMGPIEKTKNGDIIFENKPRTFVPRVLHQHVMVGRMDDHKKHFVGTEAACNKGTGLVIEGLTSGVQVSCKGGTYQYYRLENNEVLEKFHDLITDRSGDEKAYSKAKAIKSFFSGGKKEIAKDDEKRIIKDVLMEYLKNYYGSPLVEAGKRRDFDLYYEGHRNKEICSTYAGNAMILAALTVKLKANKDQLGKAAKSNIMELFDINPQNPRDLERSIKDVADKLVKDEEFRKMMEFRTPDSPPSILFQKNVNRMLPDDLLKYLSENSDNPCQLEQTN